MRSEVPFSYYALINPVRPLTRGRSYPFVEMAAVPEGGGDVKYLHEKAFSGTGSRFTIGDTLFARITPCTENGKVGRIRNLNGYSVGFGSTEFIVLAAKPGVSDPEFIYQTALWSRVRNIAVSKMMGSSGRQRVPDWVFSEEVRLPLFSMSEQQSIARTLQAIDTAIERTEAVIAATEALRQALLHDLLTHGVPGWHTEFKQVPGIGTVPAAWEVVRLGDVCARPEYGASAPAVPFTLELPRYIRITDIDDSGRLRDDDIKSVVLENEQDYLLKVDDVLFVRSGATVGKTYLHRTCEQRSVFAGYLIRFRPQRSRLLPSFLFLLTQSGFYRAWVNRMLRAGAQPNINATEYSSLLIPLPSLEEQNRISMAINSVDDVVDRLREQSSALHRLKTSVADALLTGRVRVPVANEVVV